jgi:hypothetical protein
MLLTHRRRRGGVPDHVYRGLRQGERNDIFEGRIMNKNTILAAAALLVLAACQKQGATSGSEHGGEGMQSGGQSGQSGQSGAEALKDPSEESPISDPNNTQGGGTSVGLQGSGAGAQDGATKRQKGQSGTQGGTTTGQSGSDTSPKGGDNH